MDIFKINPDKILYFVFTDPGASTSLHNAIVFYLDDKRQDIVYDETVESEELRKFAKKHSDRFVFLATGLGNYGFANRDASLIWPMQDYRVSYSGMLFKFRKKYYMIHASYCPEVPRIVGKELQLKNFNLQLYWKGLNNRQNIYSHASEGGYGPIEKTYIRIYSDGLVKYGVIKHGDCKKSPIKIGQLGLDDMERINMLIDDYSDVFLHGTISDKGRTIDATDCPTDTFEISTRQRTVKFEIYDFDDCLEDVDYQLSNKTIRPLIHLNTVVDRILEKQGISLEDELAKDDEIDLGEEF